MGAKRAQNDILGHFCNISCDFTYKSAYKNTKIGNISEIKTKIRSMCHRTRGAPGSLCEGDAEEEKP